MDFEEIDLGNGLSLRHVVCDPFSTGRAQDLYEIWDTDPVDDMPVFTGDYLAYDFVVNAFRNHNFADAADILIDEILG